MHAVSIASSQGEPEAKRRAHAEISKDFGAGGLLLGVRMCEADESTLVARSKGGDWEAFAELVRRHQRMIHALTYRMCDSPAYSEDLAHETFVRAYRSLGTFRGESKFSSWLYRIAINLCIRWRRSEVRRANAESAWADCAKQDSGDDTASERVHVALARLSPKLRAAVVLTALEGLSHAEAAHVLGCAEKTLSWRLFVARRRLGAMLGAPREGL
jgi:RNA polymerase sigma-70 factor (ECF subfamily)